MKPRTVIVVLEIETDMRLNELRDRRMWDHFTAVIELGNVCQVQVSVAQPAKAAKKKRRP